MGFQVMTNVAESGRGELIYLSVLYCLPVLFMLDRYSMNAHTALSLFSRL